MGLNISLIFILFELYALLKYTIQKTKIVTKFCCYCCFRQKKIVSTMKAKLRLKQSKT